MNREEIDFAATMGAWTFPCVACFATGIVIRLLLFRTSTADWLSLRPEIASPLTSWNRGMISKCFTPTPTHTSAIYMTSPNTRKDLTVSSKHVLLVHQEQKSGRSSIQPQKEKSNNLQLIDHYGSLVDRVLILYMGDRGFKPLMGSEQDLQILSDCSVAK